MVKTEGVPSGHGVIILTPGAFGALLVGMTRLFKVENHRRLNECLRDYLTEDVYLIINITSYTLISLALYSLL